MRRPVLLALACIILLSVAAGSDQNSSDTVQRLEAALAVKDGEVPAAMISGSDDIMSYLGRLGEANRTQSTPEEDLNRTAELINVFLGDKSRHSITYSYPSTFSVPEVDANLRQLYGKISPDKVTYNQGADVLGTFGNGRSFSYEKLTGLGTGGDEEDLIAGFDGDTDGKSEDFYYVLGNIASRGDGEEMSAYDAVSMAEGYGERLESLLGSSADDGAWSERPRAPQNPLMPILRGEYGDEDDDDGRDYAVIVGINWYSDRRGLHNCINDADFMERVLQMQGYEVIKLTDETERKPTKHNILEGALAEINLKEDRRKVIFYFSGHAEIDDQGDFYLIPRDGNGDPSSYIDKEAVEKYIKDLDNLAVIIDACNSGGFDYAAREGQIVITSSRRDEPSNEDWFGSYSVFTYQLCSAINEESRQNNEVLLQRCFNRARINTIQWSNRLLLSQTPEMTDMTGGWYFLS